MSVVEFVPALNRRKLVTRLRELEALHGRTVEEYAQKDISENLRGVVQGWHEAFGDVADWIELGEFDGVKGVTQ